MEKVNQDILAALEKVNTHIEDDCVFRTYSTPFLFGTESQEGVNKAVGYKDKDVLTVASSGDQYLGSVYYGANTVDLFDINRFTYYITCLKVAALRKLSYEEFLSFFIPLENKRIRKEFWDYKTFKKLLYELPVDAATFWDKVIYEAKRKNFGQFMVLGMSINELETVQNGMPFYSDEKEYYVLQGLLQNRKYPTFYEADLAMLSDVLVGQYDILYLSNIVECMVVDILNQLPFASSSTENWVESDVIRKIGPHIFKLLKEDGTVVVDYRANKGMEDSNDLLFNNDYFEITEIPCKMEPDKSNKHDPTDTDLVLTYKPSKTGSFL